MQKKIHIILIASLTVAFAISGFFMVMRFLDFNAVQNQLYEIAQAKIDTAVCNQKSFTNTEKKHELQELKTDKLEDYDHLYMLNETAFISYCDEWDEQKLELLAEELLKNKHGDEINYLSQVRLDPTDSSTCSGFQETSKEIYKLPITYYNVIPSKINFKMITKLSIITLMDADKMTTIEEMAPILSHEYGHHYTEYYFGLTYTNKDKKTNYYKIRGLGNENIRFDLNESYSEYLNNHMWYLFEIGAEDYAYLMGSDTGKPIVEFYDTYDKLVAYSNSESRYDAISYTYAPSLNGTPHENTVLPMPCQVDGLAEYFYSFIDEDPPSYTEVEPIGDLNLEMVKSGSMSYRITWDMPYTDNDIVYTLLVCDEDQRLWFIEKSVYGDERAKAKMGDYKLEKGSWIYSMTSGIDRGTQLFLKVSITFPDGTVIISDPVELIF